MLAQIIRTCAKIDPTEPKLSRQKKLTVCVARALGRESLVTAAFLGELIGTRFDDEELAELRAARIDARLMGDRIQRAFAEWLGGECRRLRRGGGAANTSRQLKRQPKRLSCSCRRAALGTRRLASWPWLAVASVVSRSSIGSWSCSVLPAHPRTDMRWRGGESRPRALRFI
jgi:hypothetical protein